MQLYEEEDTCVSLNAIFVMYSHNPYKEEDTCMSLNVIFVIYSHHPGNIRRYEKNTKM
jgi:hypothetical protein